MGAELLKSYDEIKARYDFLSQQMSDPKILSDTREMRKLGREHTRLERVLAGMEAYRKALDVLAEVNALEGWRAGRDGQGRIR